VKTDQWYDLTDESPLEPRTLEFDAAKIAEMKQTLENYDEQWRAYFERHRISVLEIVYEDFAQEYEATIQRVLEFLAPARLQAARRPVPRLRRQADDRTFEWLHRFSVEAPEQAARTKSARRKSADYNREGARHFRHGEFDLAEACWRRALEWDALSAAALQNLASVLAAQRKYEEARIYFYRALKRSPENADVCRNLALTYERSGLLDDAERFYARAAQLAPDSGDLRRHLARIAQKRHQTNLQPPVLPQK
jgi:tetratricopeptide (TPR) repeat protein